MPSGELSSREGRMVRIGGQALAVPYNTKDGTVEDGLPCLLALVEIKHEVPELTDNRRTVG